MSEIPETQSVDPPILSRIEQLHASRREILRLAPEKAMERILSAKEPAALVHSFSEEDLHCLILDIGPEDALPLIALASDRQLQFILDQVVWEKDRLALTSVIRWMGLLVRADPDRLVAWFSREQISTLEICLFRALEVRVREHDQDPSEFGEGFFSLDNVIYLRPVELSNGKLARDILADFLKRLADLDYRRFQDIVLESVALLPAEVEEEAYRLRNVRLGEKGFLPFDEAVGVYQPIRQPQLEKRARRRTAGYAEPGILPPAPVLTSADSHNGFLFTDALRLIDSAESRETLNLEFAALCNQLAVADQVTVRGRADLTPIVRKACAYVSIGLETLVRHRTPETGQRPDPRHWLDRHGVSDLFRLGYGEGMAVKWQAEKWVEKSWFFRHGLPLTFWGEAWTGVLGGLLLKRPRFYDDRQAGVLYREFERLQEIEESAKTLRRIQAMDELLSHLGIEDIPKALNRVLSYENLLLTLWARHELNLTESVAPIPVALFRPFYSRIVRIEGGGGAESAAPEPETKDAMRRWLVHRTGMDPVRLGETVGDILDALFMEIQAEYGAVRIENLDPRFIHLFLLEG
ncbi:MAG: DUF6178 family protein [Desulfobacterales bacterium]